MPELAIGSSVGGYRVERSEDLPNLRGRYIELTHVATGARHLHVACPDENNGFAVTFPTVPKDSTGVAHILEHCALAGSRKFPVKDPFFSMLPRSLNTFMNAFTSSDWTMYPFSTRNEKDFYNLLDVYLDACFFPLLSEEAFMQEGHRLEFADPLDPSSGLERKGVVFNEMKGVMSTAREVMDLTLGKALLPDLTYANNYGGDPERIPDLTWDALRDFHASHYHPSNALFFTYGSLPLERTLATIDASLDGFGRITPDVHIPDQPRRTSPTRVEVSYPLSPDEDQDERSQVLVSWLTVHVADQFEMLAMRVLELVLLDNPASPLHHALVSSGLGEALADGTGLAVHMREAPFSAGLQGTTPDQADAIEKLVIETLETLARDGIDRALIDSAIHQLELETREVSNSGGPYGIKLVYEVVGPALYGGDPYRSLRVDAELDRLRGAEPGFFEGLIREHLLDNPHRTTIVLTPDPTLEERREQSEREIVAGIEASLDDAGKAKIVEAAERLKARQEAKEDLSLLPSLELSDVPLDVEGVPYTTDGSVGAFSQPTNGLSYVDLRVDAARLPDELLRYVPLFAFALSRTGAGRYGYVEMAERIAASTGGVAGTPAVRAPLGVDAPQRAIRIFGKALVRNTAPLLEILGDLLTGVRFDRPRLKEIVGELRSLVEGTLEQQSTQLAYTIASARLAPIGIAQERFSGASQLANVRRLAELDEDALGPVVDALDELRSRLFTSSATASVTSDDEGLPALRDGISSLIGSLPRGADAPITPVTLDSGTHEARTASVAVAYNAKVFRTAAFGDADAPVLSVLSEYLRTTFLHREIREAGGAYGGGAEYDAERGLFALLSFRDPHIERTFEVYGHAFEVGARAIDPEDVRDAILSASASLDPLLSPDTKGSRRFYDDRAGYTIDKRAAFRRGVLSVTPDDLVRVAASLAEAQWAAATVGPAPLVNEANAAMGGVFNVQPI